MKNLFLGILLVISTTTYAVDNPFKKRNAIKKTVKWECKHLPYKDVVSVPVEEYIDLQIWEDKNGNLKTKIKPDIFSEDLFSSGKKFFNKYVKKSSGPKKIVDFNHCLQDFYEKVEADLKKHNKSCRGCIASVENTLDKFKKDISNKKLLKDSKTKEIIPPYIPGHDLVSWIKSDDIEKAIKKLCRDQELSNKEKTYITSNKIYSHLNDQASSIDGYIDDTCLKKVTDFNLNLVESWDCTRVRCENYKKTIDEYSNLAKELNNKRNQAKFSKEESIIIKAGSDLYLAEDLTDDSKEKLFNSLDGTGSYCYSRSQMLTYKDGTKKSYRVIDDNPGLVSEFLQNNTKLQNHACAQKMLSDIMAINYRIEESLESEYCKKRGCLNIEKKLEEYDEAIATLITFAFGEEKIKYYCEKKDDISAANPGFQKQIENLVKEIDDVHQCSDIKPGEYKVVNRGGGDSPSKIQQRYLLERFDQNNLKATLALKFPDGEQGDKMHKDVKECLDKMSNYFKGGNKEKIKVNIITKDERLKIPANKRPPVVNIQLQEAGARSHSMAYAADAGCGTMTHEVLHLMGLCDEYKEQSTGYYVDVATGEILDKDKGPDLKAAGKAKFVLAYNACRSIAESNSIMSSHWRKINDTVKYKRSCKCPKNLCQSILKKKNPKHLKYLTNNPWIHAYKLKHTNCNHTFVKQSKITSTSAMNNFPDNPIVKLKESKNSLEFYNYEMNIGIGTTGTIYKRKYKCTCEQEDCANEMGLLKEAVANGHSQGEYCPAGMTSTESLKYFGDEPSGFGDLIDGEFTFINDPPSKSLLHTAHFNRIKWGSCASKVKKYNECAKNAYKRLAKDCPDVPDYCKDEDKWLKSGE